MEEYPVLWRLAEQGLVTFPHKYKTARLAVLTREGRKHLAEKEKRAVEKSAIVV